MEEDYDDLSSWAIAPSCDSRQPELPGVSSHRSDDGEVDNELVDAMVVQGTKPR